MSTGIATVPKMQMITPDLVRASVHRALQGLERAAEEIVWQIEMEAWRTLGYPSWSAMREAEYGGAAVMLPTGSRPRVAERLKAIQVGTTSRGGSKHLTDQEIANTLGVSRRQVQADLTGNNEKCNSARFAGPDDDVIDAEIVEDELINTPNEVTDPAPAESVNAITCPTCHGTGKVTP